MQGFGNLLEGYRRFRANRFETERGRWQELAEGQSPRAVVIACSDSRADPATIFDTTPARFSLCAMLRILCLHSKTGGGRHGVSACARSSR
jgi:carbonic anhydrase